MGVLLFRHGSSGHGLGLGVHPIWTSFHGTPAETAPHRPQAGSEGCLEPDRCGFCQEVTSAIP